MGTQVITRDTGRALGLRDNPLPRFLPGLPRWMPLDRIRQVGDVILVDSADSLSEAFSPERYSRVINCQVITESGQQLGRVLGFSFDIETGELTTLVMGAVGVPLLGEGVLSTWEIPVDEIVSSGADRIIVYEGAEEKLKQLNSGFLEKLGVGGPSWEEQERDRYRVNVVPVENQLSSGQSAEDTPRQLGASSSQRFDVDQDELEYVELEQPRQDEVRRRRYLDELPLEEDPERYQPQESYQPRESYQSRDFDSEPPRYDEAPPQPRSDQRPRPASRRPIERPGEPLDVEPLDDEPQSSAPREPMDDPW